MAVASDSVPQPTCRPSSEKAVAADGRRAARGDERLEVRVGHRLPALGEGLEAREELSSAASSNA